MHRIRPTTFKWLFWSWFIIIFVFSSIPWLTGGSLSLRLPVTEIKLELRLDYFLHAFMFFLLATFFIQWKKHWIRNNFLVSLIAIIIVSIAISFLVECYQLLIPGRVYNINDSFFNAIGIGIGIIFSIAVIASPKGRKT